MADQQVSEGAASAVPSSLIVSDIDHLTDELVASGELEIEVRGVNYRLKVSPTANMISVFYQFHGYWYEVNDGTWSHQWGSLDGSCACYGCRKKRNTELSREGHIRHATRTVLIALFAGHDLSGFSCGMSIDT